MKQIKCDYSVLGIKEAFDDAEYEKAFILCWQRLTQSCAFTEVVLI